MKGIKGFQKGNREWKLKKKFKHSENSIEKIKSKSIFQKGYKLNLGMKATEITKEKLRKSHLGKTGYWKGKKRPDIKEKIRKSLIGKTGELSRNWKGGIDIENRRIR